MYKHNPNYHYQAAQAQAQFFFGLFTPLHAGFDFAA
jgi:hypothetical protein